MIFSCIRALHVGGLIPAALHVVGKEEISCMHEGPLGAAKESPVGENSTEETESLWPVGGQRRTQGVIIGDGGGGVGGNTQRDGSGIFRKPEFSFWQAGFCTFGCLRNVRADWKWPGSAFVDVDYQREA